MHTCCTTVVAYINVSLAPLPKVWTPSIHVLWSSSAQHTVHIVVAALSMISKINPQKHLPYELVEIILRHTIEPSVTAASQTPQSSDRIDCEEESILELDLSEDGGNEGQAHPLNRAQDDDDSRFKQG